MSLFRDLPPTIAAEIENLALAQENMELKQLLKILINKSGGHVVVRESDAQKCDPRFQKFITEVRPDGTRIISLEEDRG